MPMNTETLSRAEDLLARRFGGALSGLLQESDFSGTPRQWCLARYPYAQHVANEQRLLDVGCANGLLLKSLQIWTGFALQCFGIDNNEKRITSARQLFSGSNPSNFVTDDMLAGNWIRDPYDLVLLPFIKRPSWLDLANRYLAENPRSTLVFSVYDDEWENASEVEGICSKQWGDSEFTISTVEGLTKLIAIKGRRKPQT